MLTTPAWAYGGGLFTEIHSGEKSRVAMAQAATPLLPKPVGDTPRELRTPEPRRASRHRRSLGRKSNFALGALGLKKVAARGSRDGALWEVVSSLTTQG